VAGNGREVTAPRFLNDDIDNDNDDDDDDYWSNG
jgi:hypothetical protein